MDTRRQLRLLLWKDYLVRKKQPWLVFFVFGWTLVAFLVLYIVRHSIEPDYYSTCQHQARALPSAGLFKFLQSFICTVDNKCAEMDTFEEIPQYRNAVMTDMINAVEPIYKDENFRAAVDDLPNIKQLINAVIQAVDDTNNKMMGDGIEIYKLLKDPDKLRGKLKRETSLDDAVIDAMFQSALQYDYILDMMDSSQMESVVCDPKQLGQYLTLPDRKHLEEVSTALCNIPVSRVPSIIENVGANANLDGLLQIMSNTTKLIKDYNVYSDVGQVVKTILEFKVFRNVFPNEEFVDWVPKLFPLLKDLLKHGVTPKLYNDVIDILTPHYGQTSVWEDTKDILKQIFDTIILIQNTTRISLDDVPQGQKFDGYLTQLQKHALDFDNLHSPTVQKAIFGVVNSTFDIIHHFLADDYMNYPRHVAKIIDAAVHVINPRRSFLIFHTNVFFSLINAATHLLNDMYCHITGADEILYSVSFKHRKAVTNILSLGEGFVTDLSACLANISCSLIIAKAKDDFSQLVCQERIIQTVFPNTPNVAPTLCNNDTVLYFKNIHTEFEIDNLHDILDVYAGDLQEWHDNLLVETVENVQKLFTRLFYPKINVDWSVFQENFTNVWGRVNRYKAVYLVNLRLNSVKDTEKLQKSVHMISDIHELVKGVLLEIDLIPTKLLTQIQSNLPELIGNVLKLFTDNFKKLAVTPLDKWTKFFCPSPSESDDDRAKTFKLLSCQAAKYVSNQVGYMQNIWMDNPYFSDIHGRLKGAGLNWEEFVTNVQTTMTRLQDLLENKPAPFSWGDLFRESQKYWYTLRDVDFATAMQLGFQMVNGGLDIISKLQYTEYDEQNQKALRDNSLQINNFYMLLNKVTELATSIQSFNPSFESVFPLTYQNLASLRSSFTNTSQSPVEIFAVLEFSTNNTLINEWNSEIQAIQPNNIQAMEVAIASLRRIIFDVQNFATPIQPQESERWSAAVKQLHITNELIEIENVMIQNATRNNIPTNNGLNSTLSEIWDNYIDGNCLNTELLYSCRKLKGILMQYSFNFALNAIGHIAQVMTNYLENIFAGPIDPVVIAGFSNTSIMSRWVRNLPKYIALFVHNYRDPSFANKVRSVGPQVSCGQALQMLEIPESIQLTRDDLEVIKTYFCSSHKDFKQENLFFQLIIQLHKDLHWIPANEIPVAHASSNLMKLQLAIANAGPISSIQVDKWYTEDWVQQFNETLNDLSRLNFTVENSISNYLGPFLSYPGIKAYVFVVNHVFESLKLFDNETLTSSDLTYNAELKKLVELADKHPLQFTELLTVIILDYLQTDPHMKFNGFLAKFCSDHPTTGNQLVDHGNVYEQFCSVDFNNITKPLFNDSKLGDLEFGPFNVEHFLKNVISGSIRLASLVSAGNLKFSPFNNFNWSDTVISREARWNRSVALADIISKWPTSSDGYLYAWMDVEETVYNILQGGNWWQRLKQQNLPALNIITGTLETISYLPMKIVELITTPNLVNVLEKYIRNDTHFCDINLNVSRDSIIFYIRDILCFVRRHFESINYNKGNLTEKLFNYQNNYFDLIKHGPSLLEIPHWINKDIINKKYTEFLDKYKDDHTLYNELGIIYKNSLDILEFNHAFGLCDWCLEFKEIVKTFLRITPFDIEHFLKNLISRSIQGKMNLSVFDNFNLSDTVISPEARWKRAVDLTEITSKSNLFSKHFLYAWTKIQETLYNILKGGDWWQQIKNQKLHELNIVAGTLENIPYLPLQVAELMSTPNLVNMVEKHLQSGTHFCDINFMNNNISADTLIFYIQEIACFVGGHYRPLSFPSEYTNNVTQIFFKNQNDYYDLVVQGHSPFKTPHWLDQENINKNYDDFVHKYEDVNTLYDDIVVVYKNSLSLINLYRVGHCDWCVTFKATLSGLLQDKYINMTCILRHQTCELFQSDTKNISGVAQSVSVFINVLKYFSRDLLRESAPGSPIRHFFTQLDEHIIILKPIQEVMTFDFTTAMQKYGVNEDTNWLIMHSYIDVNQLEKMMASEQTAKYFTSYKWFNKLFSFKPTEDSEEIFYNMSTKLSSDFYPSFVQFVRTDWLNANLPTWRNQSIESFDWLNKLFNRLNKVVYDSTGILHLVSEISLGSVSSEFERISQLADGIIELLERNSTEILFQSLKLLINDLSPVINNPEMEEELYGLIERVESLDVFKHLGFLRNKYNISSLTDKWTGVDEFLMEEFKLKRHIAEQLTSGSIDLFNVFSLNRKMLNMTNFLCNPDTLSKMFRFDKENVTQINRALCSMGLDDLQMMFKAMIQDLNVSGTLDDMITSNKQRIISNASLSEVDGERVLSEIGYAMKLLSPAMNTVSKVSHKISELSTKEPSSTDSIKNTFTMSGQLLCGRKFVEGNEKFFQSLTDVEDFNDEYDITEQNSISIPTCRAFYKNIIKLKGGKIIWSFVKPLLRGKILYTPNTKFVTNIIQNANSSFENMAQLRELVLKMSGEILSMDVAHVNESLAKLQKFLNSTTGKVVSNVIMSSITNWTDVSSTVNISHLINIVQESQTSFQTNGVYNHDVLRSIYDLFKCTLLDRFEPVESEDELELRAKQYMRTNEFYAGLVFLNVEDKVKRSVDAPRNIAYKIRMDIDSVPTTKYLKYKFWVPGPEDDFLENLRYFRGFVQLQDMVDHAIIKTQGSNDMNWTTYAQQIPYPCYKYDFFQSALNISQLLQVAFFFGLIVIVSTSVRYLVAEKESGNTLIMNVMGINHLTHAASWFIVTYLMMVAVMLLVFLIMTLGNIVPLTNAFILFVFLMLFGLSVVSFCYMISSVFKSASLAGVGSVMFYLLSYMPYIIIISIESDMPTWLKVFVNFSMSTSFSYGCLYILRYEIQGVGLQWNNMWSSPQPNDDLNFGVTCLFLIIDALLYAFIGHVCDRIAQDSCVAYSKLLTWWQKKFYSVLTEQSYLSYDSQVFSLLGEGHLENSTIQSSLSHEEPRKVGVTIKNLKKIYNTSKNPMTAIKDINMSLYTGQITTLLGHNGAGKTTLIKILTGMMRPTEGQIIINSEITNYNKLHEYLGVCPQDSVLLENLTPLEHLQFYAQIKTGKTMSAVMEDVLNMLDNLGLDMLAGEPVFQLSEGNRRRLCVAIAFIGRPSLVVLDEPSSGVDPVARRQIWDLIVKLKKGCTILMTTHHLDEAELLSDKVVVLHKGQILSSGSPLTLKHTHGDGYKLTATFPENQDNKDVINKKAHNLLNFITDLVPNASISDTQAHRMNVIVPFVSPEGSPNDFEGLTVALEQNQIHLGFESMAINCTTLEQVYLEMCAQQDGVGADDTHSLSSTHKFKNSDISVGTEMSDDYKTPINKDNGSMTGPWHTKFLALLLKRAIHYTQDWQILMCAFVLPTLFIAIAMGFSLIRPPNFDEPALRLTTELYQDTSSFISMYDDEYSSDVAQRISWYMDKPIINYNMTFHSTNNCVCKYGSQTCDAALPNAPHNSLIKIQSAVDTAHWAIITQPDYIEKRYGGWSIVNTSNQDAFIVWYNNKGYHALPSYLNTINNAILQTVNPEGKITTFNHPLKLSVEQLSKDSIAQHVADVGISTMLLIAFCLVPASASIYLVQERMTEEKRLQLLSGVSPTLYWCVAWLWDMIVLVCAIILAVIVFKIFSLPTYVARDNLPAICLLIFLYGWATIPFVHVLEKMFKDASMANMMIFCYFIFIGIVEQTCLLLLDILGRTQLSHSIRDVLYNIYLVFPQFAFGDGLVQIAKNTLRSELLTRFHMDTYQSPLGWNLIGPNYLWLAIVGTLLFMLNLIIENKWFPFMQRSKSVSLDTCVLETQNLTKEYKVSSGTKTAVGNLKLKVPYGQCLGLIGVNGAGKSTTFKMLTTELCPTSGKIFILGKEVGPEPLCSGEMGYCPQYNALDHKLTVKQTLNIYASLLGIINKDETVLNMMKTFELLAYVNRRTEHLSGGNKRKLCAAISMLGKCPIILMDEPTSGMDVYARQLVAQSIKQTIRQSRSVILTSHCVEDCESLCSVVAVMINGRLVCMGSPQELKERYGSGYNISVRLSNSSDQMELEEQMMKYFSKVELQNVHYCTSQFIVATDRISEIFRNMKAISSNVPIEEYNLVQSSLDQVFINLACKKNLDHSNHIPLGSLPNMYSMDIF